ncbi:MAG: PPC domain-containing protein, partial [Planctomycetes bacterium]|nr:PPC domain-containing protein [Planctomycetota bacterium]
MEAEPNDDPPAAPEVDLPAAFNGQFQQPGDVDHFRFAVKKGEKLIIRGLSRTLGSPAYLFLRVFDEKVASLAEAGAGNHVETLTFSAPADGVYRLTVAELLGAGGTSFAYRVEVEPEQPRFSLALKNDKNVQHKFLTNADGAFALDVQADRQGYNGPIRLSLATPREGFQLRQDTIPAGGKETRLLVLVPPDVQEGELLTLRIVGEAIEGEARAELSTAALLKTKRPELPSVPSWMDGAIHAAVGSPPAPFFALTATEETVVFDREKREAKFALTLERKNKDYKQDPIVLVEGLPADATAALKKEGKDQDERLEITVAGKDLPAGEHPFQILAFGEHGARGLKVAMTVKLKVE